MLVTEHPPARSKSFTSREKGHDAIQRRILQVVVGLYPLLETEILDWLDVLWTMILVGIRGCVDEGF